MIYSRSDGDWDGSVVHCTANIRPLNVPEEIQERRKIGKKKKKNFCNGVGLADSDLADWLCTILADVSPGSSK